MKPQNFKNKTPEEMRQIASRGGLASRDARRKEKKRQQLVADVVRNVLSTPTANGSTVLEDLTKAIIARMFDSGTARDLATLADIMGEMARKVELQQPHMPAINIEILGGDDRPELTAAEEMVKAIEAKEEEGGGDE